MILRSLEGKFYQIDEKELAGKEVPSDKVEGLPASLPPPPEGGDVEGHNWCDHHHHWYNWHNHQWHDCHWHNHHHH